MARAKLPAPIRAIIAEHEAGKHDVDNGGYPTKGPQPKTCRDCARIADLDAKDALTITKTAKPSRVRIVKSSDPTFPIEKRVEIVAPKTRERREARRIEALIAAVPLPEPALVGEVIEPTVDPAAAGARIHDILTALYAGQKYDTREAWMLAAVEAMRPWFVDVNAEVGPVRISIGWPGGRSAKGKGIRGQCWASHTVADGIPAIFVTPDQSDPILILGIILHEMNHASDNCLSGHRGTFAKTAKALGFLAPWTDSSGKTDELIEKLTNLLADLGTFPHGAINDKAHGLTGLSPARPPVQTTRMILLTCSVCGYIVRTTRKWIDIGTPSCPNGDPLEEAV